MPEQLRMQQHPRLKKTYSKSSMDNKPPEFLIC